MAKSAAEETQEEGAKKGGKLGLLIVAIVCLALGAGGAFVALRVTAKPAAQAPEAAAEAEAAPEESATAALRERLVALDPFVVNVTGDGYPRYLKLKLELEGADLAAREEIEARTPQIRDAIIVLLSSKRLADVSDFEGKALLKEDILERVNDLLEGGDARSVLFTEFVVQ